MKTLLRVPVRVLAIVLAIGCGGEAIVSSIVKAPSNLISSTTVNGCTFTFTIQPITLSPPNHKYAVVALNDLVPGVSDSCDSNVTLTSGGIITCVSSDEAEDDLGGSDGNTLNDIEIAGATTLHLRAERDDALNGRVYTINFTVVDVFANAASATAIVTVPLIKASPALLGPGTGYSLPRSCQA
jgi:hypothetical protein